MQSYKKTQSQFTKHHKILQYDYIIHLIRPKFEAFPLCCTAPSGRPHRPSYVSPSSVVRRPIVSRASAHRQSCVAPSSVVRRPIVSRASAHRQSCDRSPPHSPPSSVSSRASDYSLTFLHPPRPRPNKKNAWRSIVESQAFSLCLLHLPVGQKLSSLRMSAIFCFVVMVVGTNGRRSTFSIIPMSLSRAFTPAGLPSTKSSL